MRINHSFQTHIVPAVLCFAGLLITGCTSTSTPDAGGGTAAPFPAKYKSVDNRNVNIGKRTAKDGGWSFKEPHLDKCWIADGFDFKGYDTIYLAPTLSTAKYHDDEERTHQLAKENLVIELKRLFASKGLCPNVAASESEIKPGAHALKLENTIIEYSKGGGAARYWVGLYGGGQPMLRVQGKMTDGDKTVFSFEARRSGTSAGARLGGVFMKDEDIQIEDIRSLVLDLTDFLAVIAGKYQPTN